MGSNLRGSGTGPTIERGRRCQNCRSFENGPMAIQHYKACKMRDLGAVSDKILGGEKITAATIGARLGDDEKPVRKVNPPVHDLSALEAKFQALGLSYELGDNLIRTGEMGICLISAAPGDFVHSGYLCEKWTERVRPDGAEKPDELPEEARSRVFGDDK